MDPVIDANWIGLALSMLISLVLLPVGLLLWKIYEHFHMPLRGNKLIGQSAGCSCMLQVVAFIISIITIGGELHALAGTMYAALCSLASYFIMLAICKMPEKDVRWAAIWIAIVSVPAQTYAFGWAFPG
ncbi:hypothetical protein KDL29_01525 [bacterium]|nr:hypothetical protein [bacterium]